MFHRFTRWLYSRQVGRDLFCIALGYWLASAWSDRLLLAACFLAGLSAYLVRRRYVEWTSYADHLKKLESLATRSRAQ